MATIWTKQCPRCGGDLHEQAWPDRFGGGKEIICIQCSRTLNQEQEARLRAGISLR